MSCANPQPPIIVHRGAALIVPPIMTEPIPESPFGPPYGGFGNDGFGRH
jgi:hypothetical protein